MLADSIIQDPLIKAGLGSGRQRLVEDIGKAHRFVLSDEFSAAADQIMRSSPVSTAKALPLARLPYRLCWFETKFAARTAFVEGDDLGPIFRKDISRIGILIRSEDEGGLKWNCHLAWSFSTGECSIATYAAIIDISNDPPFNPQVDRTRFDDGTRTQEEVEAMYEMESRASFFLSPYFGELLAQPLFLKQVEQAGIGDWVGEPVFWATAIALLNSRNVAQIEPGPDMTKLAKARRRRGKPEPLSYSICRIVPRIIDRGTSQSGSGKSGVRAHFVRGHFKVRSTGIYWWSPHVRGQATAGVVMKHYQVD